MRAPIPVDSPCLLTAPQHVWEITKALGWTPLNASRDHAYAHLNERVPGEGVCSGCTCEICAPPDELASKPSTPETNCALLCSPAPSRQSQVRVLEPGGSA